MRDGVYRCWPATDQIQIVVAGQLPQVEHNAMLHLFSASEEQVRYGVQHFQKRSTATSTLLDRLFEGYEWEGVDMSYTMEDFLQEYVQDRFQNLTVEQKRNALQRLSAEERQEVLQGLPVKERREILQGLPAEEWLLALDRLPAEEIERYLEQRKKRGSQRRKGKR